MSDKEENSTYKVYISIYKEYEDGGTTRYLKHLLLDSFQSDEEAMECVIRTVKKQGVQPNILDDGTTVLGEIFIGKYWHQLVEKIYNE